MPRGITDDLVGEVVDTDPHGRVTQLSWPDWQRRRLEEAEVAGSTPAESTQAPRSPTGRGARPRSGMLAVRIRPWVSVPEVAATRQRGPGPRTVRPVPRPSRAQITGPLTQFRALRLYTRSMARSGTTGISTPAVCAIAGVASSTLDYWVRSGLVSPSLRGGEGKRYTRWWTTRDVVAVRAVKALRDAGCPLQKLRQARRLVDRLSKDVDSTAVLYWDGADVIAVEAWDAVYSALSHPGQQMLHLVALPMKHWHEEVSEVAVKVDLALLQERRERRRRQPATSKAVVVARATSDKEAS